MADQVPNNMQSIRQACFPDDMPAVVAIFREYVHSPSVSLDFQDYEREFAGLPGQYAAPEGRLMLACDDGAIVGCGALRRVDATTCELKRVYVRPVARGKSLGRHMVLRLLDEAKLAGYTRVCLDVLPEFVAAQRLYESLGFVAAEPVSFNPVVGTKFLELRLNKDAEAVYGT
jgi:GNAT superfamily N-acetyltransferase